MSDSESDRRESGFHEITPPRRIGTQTFGIRNNMAQAGQPQQVPPAAPAVAAVVASASQSKSIPEFHGKSTENVRSMDHAD